MIRKEDLLDAISECQGERNPNANTCIKLAAYYTILNQLTGVDSGEQVRYSKYDSGTEFSEAIAGRNMNDVLAIMDELMDVVSALAPRIYEATIVKLRG